MKIRISGNSLRLRLKQLEVSHFQQHGNIMEVIEFGPEPTDQLRFSLEITSETKFAVAYTPGHTSIRVPKQVAKDWTSTEQVGFNARVSTGKGWEIELLVEKDFLCLDRPEGDNTDAYPNPKAFC